jgi:hypothetical protein
MKAMNKHTCPIFVIPAKAGIQWFQRVLWMPAFAGMTTKELVLGLLNTGERIS